MKHRLIVYGSILFAVALSLFAGIHLNAQRPVNANVNKSAHAQKTQTQKAQPQQSGSTSWTMIGPTSVTSLTYGAVAGRVTALALDPSDTTGNSLYVGVTGGGVWHSSNAASSTLGNISFTPLTDDLAAMQAASLPSLSIGALTVQPGGTGVVLAGTGDPNDAFDSYYGDGILYTTSDGSTWTLITNSSDLQGGFANQNFYFTGEAFAGFAWSTTSTQTVVVAVTQAYRGYLDNAIVSGLSYEGLYYSPNGGATWYLSTINDSAGNNVQGPLGIFVGPDGNAATSVVWNPVRQLFIAAIRYHGYYQSPDGITWTRLANQPGTGLTTPYCPTNTGSTGSTFCPIFRGSLAVNPLTGDTFAWTVDENLQDQGIWQDQCSISSGACTNQTITFATQLNTSALESNTTLGSATIPEGDYNLTLVAVPNEQDTDIFAGDSDLWKCSIAAGCIWRNTTNALSCMSAEVSPFQHTFAWDIANSQEVFVGNDGGLWRSMDQVSETGSVCNPSDDTHFQNLNGSLGSIAEIGSLSQAATTPDSMIAGLGEDGTVGVKGLTTPPFVWLEILSGYGGTVVIDPNNSMNWYVNNQVGVNINACTQSGACTPSSFGSGAVITEADVEYDGYSMLTPAAFIVDPMDETQALVATCRIWRGPVNGSAWSSNNAISGILDNSSNSFCNGDAVVRSLASQMDGGTGTEMIYAGMFGGNISSSIIPGHIFSANYNPTSGSAATWNDLTENTVTNSSFAFNTAGADVSGIYIDLHDVTGNTVYVTIGAVPTQATGGTGIYRSTNGGASWTSIESNLPKVPINAVAVDPQNSNVVYIALDSGVYFTATIESCATVGANCWSPYGESLPMAPAVQLIATPLGALTQALTVGTYGRGIWQIPLYTSGTANTTATLTPSSSNFGNQVENVPSGADAIVLKNTGSVTLTPTLITMTGDFTETDNCVNASISPGQTCTINVIFTPASLGALSGSMVVNANVSGGQVSATFTGTGVAPGNLTLVPGSWSYGGVQIGTTSATESFTVSNSGGVSVSISSVGVSTYFSILSNSCGNSLAANTSCAIGVAFKPTIEGSVGGTLTVVSSGGTQTATLTGNGMSAPTETLSTNKLTFPSTSINSSSAPMTVTLTNNGDEPLTSIGDSITGYFSVTDNCGSTLAGHSSCTFSVIFTPLSIISNDVVDLYITSALGQQVVILVGSGVADPVISFTLSSYKFQNQEEYTASGVYTVNFYNSGPTTVTGLNFSITGQGASSMAISYAVSSPCGTSLGGGIKCNIGVIFTPQSVGTIQANLIATSNYPDNQSVTLPMSGVSIEPPVITAAQSSLQFGPVTEGTTSNAQEVNIQNTGATALSDLQWSITTGAPAFAVTSSTTCTASLAVSQSCIIYVNFSPTTTSTYYGVLTISSKSGAAAPITVTLNGVGNPPSTITTSVSEVDFGNQVTGQASASQTITISANGSEALSGLTYTTTAGSSFTAQAGTCTSTLTKSGSCTEKIIFDPSVVGYQTANLTIATTTQYVSPVEVFLTGTGISAALIQASPTAVNFGSVLIGQTSAVNTVTITNGGGESLTGLSLQDSGSFALTQNTCPVTLATGASCSVGITFSPTQSGQLSGSLSISTTAQGASNVSVPLSGYGLTAGALTISPTSQNFGTQTLDQPSGAEPFTLTNTGGSAAGGLAFTTTGNFSISSQTTCGSSLSGGASCKVYVIFTPTAVGNQSGQLQVSSTTSGVTTVYAGLTGTGQSGAALTVSVNQLSFPNTAVNTTSAAQTFILSNPGTATASGINIQTTGEFTNSSCPTTLAAGASCTVSVYFSPQQRRALSGTTTATSSTPGVTAASVQSTGTGTAPASLSLNPGTLSFPATLVSSTSAPLSIVISNPGTAALNTPTLAITGDFAIQSNGCTQTLAAGGNCTVTVTFTPTIVGGRSGFLTVSSTTNGVSSVFAALSGTGESPATLSASPQTLTFPTLSPGQVSATQTVTVTVTGGVGVSGIQAVADPGFVVAQNNCTGVLQSGGSCTVLVEFAPAAVGNYTGQLTISGTGVQTAVSVALSGVSDAPPTVQSSPGQVSFQTTGVGITSAPFTLQLTNQSPNVAITGMVLAIQSTPLAGVNYQISGTTCTSTLAASANCNVSITFTPGTAGPAAAAWLVVNGANLASPAQVPLYGVGLAYTFEPSGVSSVTVASGQVANYNFTITIPPLSGAQGVFTLSCSSLPLNATCIFVPENCEANCQTITTVTATAASPGYATMAIQTGQVTTSLAPMKHGQNRWPRGALALCALLLLPLYRRKGRRVLLAIVLLCIVVVGISSCTESKLLGIGPPGGGGGASSATPPGTYTILVTASADGLSEQTSVTLTVD
jgi:hypothetical protein